MTKSLLAALSLALAVAFSAPLLATTSANAQTTQQATPKAGSNPHRHKKPHPRTGKPTSAATAKKKTTY
jgi:hypothetical protein